ncbi:helix-turn-helix transcriptional regulator [Roseovarius sp.]|uniref:helix-turn-helix transcriptional regulator n=1 Tax=Roseovarius sp. TaxID=1486281 RepID=UPI0035686826
MTKNFSGSHATSGIVFDDFVLQDEIVFEPKTTQASFRLVKDTEAAATIGVSKATWWRRVADGTMPQPIRIGSITRWKLSEIAAAIEKLAKERPPVDTSDTVAFDPDSATPSTLSDKHLRKKEDK